MSNMGSGISIPCLQAVKVGMANSPMAREIAAVAPLPRSDDFALAVPVDPLWASVL